MVHVCFRRMLLSILHFRFFKAERINKILSKRPKGLLELNDKLCVFIANHADQIILIKSLLSNSNKSHHIGYHINFWMLVACDGACNIFGLFVVIRSQF